MKEIWKDIEGYEGKYQVSNLGNVKSINYNRTGKEKLLRPMKLRNGYLIVRLCVNNKVKAYLTHRLVAQAFIENPGNRPCLDHINTIRTDNRADNLRWCTYKENNNNPITLERHMKKVICDGKIHSSISHCADYYGVSAKAMSNWLIGYTKMPSDFQVKELRYYIEE